MSVPISVPLLATAASAPVASTALPALEFGIAELVPAQVSYHKTGGGGGGAQGLGIRLLGRGGEGSHDGWLEYNWRPVEPVF